jgi:hypothetical protein
VNTGESEDSKTDVGDERKMKRKNSEKQMVRKDENKSHHRVRERRC